MKICIFSTVFHPEHFLINTLSSELKFKAHDIEVLTGLPNYPKGVLFPGYSILSGPYCETYSDFKIIRTPIIPRGKGFFQLALNYLSFVLTSCISIFRLKKPDVSFVFATSPITVAIPAIFLKWIYETPIVLWLQDLWPESIAAVGAIRSNNPIYKLIGHLVKWIYSNTDIILIQSPLFEENLKKFGFPLVKSIYVPNWAEELIYTETIPDWIKSLPNKFIVTFAGNIGIAQSVNTVIEAANLLKTIENIHFVIAGDGRELNDLIEKANLLKLSNVQFVGRKPFEEMGNLFNFSSALLVTLKKEDIFQMTVPAKTQQYLSSGKPIISAAGGISNIIIKEAQAGLTCEPESPEQLANAITELYKMPKQDLDNLGKNGRKYYQQHFKKDVVINKIESILIKASKHE